MARALAVAQIDVLELNVCLGGTSKPSTAEASLQSHRAISLPRLPCKVGPTLSLTTYRSEITEQTLSPYESCRRSSLSEELVTDSHSLSEDGQPKPPLFIMYSEPGTSLALPPSSANVT